MALAVVLLLLLGLSAVALAGLGGAIADLAVAAADEQVALAMEAAETGLARTLRSGTPIPAGTVVWPEHFPGLTVSSEIRFDPPDADAPLLNPPPGEDASGSRVLRHFTVRAEARAGRGVVTRIEQGYQSLWPPGNTSCVTDACSDWPLGVVTAPAAAVYLGTDPVKTSWRQLDTTPE
jgi:hypothetical protein